MLLEVKEKYSVFTEDEAKKMQEDLRNGANNGGYFIVDCGYAYKPKKSKGEVIDERWVVSVTKKYNDLWD